MDVRSKVCEASKCIHWLQLVPQSMQLYSCTQHLALSGVSYILEPFSEIQIVSTNHPRYLVQYKYEYIYNYILYECFCLRPPALNIFRLLRSKARRGRTYHTITGTSVLHRHESMRASSSSLGAVLLVSIRSPLTGPFAHPHADEVLWALGWNTANRHISMVRILLEGAEDKCGQQTTCATSGTVINNASVDAHATEAVRTAVLQRVSLGIASPAMRIDKISVVPVSRQPSYLGFIEYAQKKLDDHLVLLANADVTFDTTLGRIDPLAFPVAAAAGRHSTAAHRHTLRSLPQFVQIFSVTHIAGPAACHDVLAGCPSARHLEDRKKGRVLLDKRRKAKPVEFQKGQILFSSTGLPLNRFWSADAFLFRSPLRLSLAGMHALRFEARQPKDPNRLRDDRHKSSAAESGAKATEGIAASRSTLSTSSPPPPPYELAMNSIGAENRFMFALNVSGVMQQNVCRAVRLGHVHCQKKMHLGTTDVNVARMWYEPEMCSPRPIVELGRPSSLPPLQASAISQAGDSADGGPSSKNATHGPCPEEWGCPPCVGMRSNLESW